MSKGYVYILSNPSMPGLVKIGKTTRDVNARADELYQTGVPTPFKVEHSALCPDCDEVEQWVHNCLETSRVSTSREFFRLEIKDAILAVNNAHREQVEVWLQEYLPDHSISEPGYELDPSFPTIIATHVDLHPSEVVDVYGYLLPEDLTPAIRRRSDHLSGKKKMQWVKPAPVQSEALQ